MKLQSILSNFIVVFFILDLENTHTFTRNFNNKLRLLNVLFDFTPWNAKPSERHILHRCIDSSFCMSYNRECTRTLDQFGRWWISSESLLKIKHSFVITVRYEVQFVHCNMRLRLPGVKQEKKLLNNCLLIRVRLPKDDIILTLSLITDKMVQRSFQSNNFIDMKASLPCLYYISLRNLFFSQSRVISNKTCNHL